MEVLVGVTKNSLCLREFRENRLCGSHSLLKCVIEFPPVLPTFVTDLGEIRYWESVRVRFVNVDLVISILKKRTGNFVRVFYIFSLELRKIQYIKCQSNFDEFRENRRK
jgi:hypothetical protein